jgi:hypothetical protein
MICGVGLITGGLPEKFGDRYKPSMTPEGEARQKIDQQLELSGWAVQDVKAINLQARRGVAVREFPTGTGPADYMLFADGKALGIVEAKRVGVTLSIIHEQSVGYSLAQRLNDLGDGLYLLLVIASGVSAVAAVSITATVQVWSAGAPKFVAGPGVGFRAQRLSD